VFGFIQAMDGEKVCSFLIKHENKERERDIFDVKHDF
jgi:hypothetical protein